MQAQNVRLPEGWEAFEKVKKVLADKGKARVYFVSVECSGRPAGREARKLEKWIMGRLATQQAPNGSLVWLEEVMWDQKGDRGYWKPAVRMDISTVEEFAKVWWELSSIPNSSCGCAIMLNDGQASDVRVMDADHVAYGERSW